MGDFWETVGKIAWSEMGRRYSGQLADHLEQRDGAEAISSRIFRALHTVVSDHADGLVNQYRHESTRQKDKGLWSALGATFVDRTFESYREDTVADAARRAAAQNLSGDECFNLAMQAAVPSERLAYLSRGVDLGHNMCIACIGDAFLHGRDLPQNTEAAMNAFAAIHGSADGNALVYAAGSLLEAGRTEDAVEYACGAAIAGNVEGTFLVGYFYMEGVSPLARDESAAMQCFRKAAAQGHQMAAEYLRRLPAR